MTTHIFDLDRTVWDTYDVTGRPIWAKQMLRPFSRNGNTITDDVGSVCVLRENIVEYFNFLVSQGHEIGFLSVGSAWSLSEEDQPSINLLRDFGLYDLFQEIKFLEYKTTSKKQILKKIPGCVFYDDDEKHLVAAAEVPGITCVDSSEITDWSTFYE
jgi:predicted phosphatase